MQQEAFGQVYFARITRGKERYAVRKLGAFGSDLGAVACFFAQPWSRVSPALTEPRQALLLSQAAFRLRALGRPTEALAPMRAGLEMNIKQANWIDAAINATNLSELELMLGEVDEAISDAQQSVTYADRRGDSDWPQLSRTTHADALHQASRDAEGEARFREAEALHAGFQPTYPLLYSFQGFLYCDLLLAAPERAAWQVICTGVLRAPEETAAHRATLQSVAQRAAQTFDWLTNHFTDPSFHEIALDHLTLGRAALYAAILEGSSLDPCRAPLQHAVAGLRRAGTQRSPPPRPPHPRLAAISRRPPDRPRERPGRPGRGLGNRRARTHETLPGRHPPAPRPPLLP